MTMETKFNRDQDVIMIAGPTASGKTALAIDIAHIVDGVIINGDSMQIYDDLSILTACPSEEEQNEAPHHLYNHLDGAEACSVGKWMGLVREEVEKARQKGKVPILCGGTALYLNAAQHGISAIPDIPETLHLQVMAEHRSLGGEAMLAHLKIIDPEIGNRLAPGDSQRITRAIEVFRHTNRPLSAWQNDPPQGQLTGNFVNISILPERASLYERINQRFDLMWDRGAVEEVGRLLARNLTPTLPVMKAVGVPQIARYLQGECNKQTAIEEAQRESRRYAKRQFTFFRNNFITNFEIDETYSARKKFEFFSKILL